MKISSLFIIVCFFSISSLAAYPVLRLQTPFSGSRLYAPNDSNKHTSIVMLHGSEGGSEPFIDSEAAILATQGFSVLVLCYFDCNRGLSDPKQTLKNVEATIVLDAVAWLRSQTNSNSKVVVYGFSRGAELTMITGSLDMNPANRPNALIAHSPSDKFVGPMNWNWLSTMCWICKAGVTGCSKTSQRSDYTWNLRCGPDDPNDPTKMDFSKSAWLISGASIPAGKRIEIEKYSGPILITVGEMDEVWPVAQTQNIEKALKDAGKKPEIHYFPNEGHAFKGQDETTRRELVLTFLEKI